MAHLRWTIADEEAKDITGGLMRDAWAARERLKGRTLKAIGKDLGVSRERIHQMLKRRECLIASGKLTVDNSTV